jgi:hypothetical protein
MHGKGTMTYADGGVYVGEYKDGKRVMVRWKVWYDTHESAIH